ncbi:MAG: hypothetical protein KGR25_04925 [Chloroflexi bacterium]|nr:hypothetical protein [Chloroflexota bacterium]
MTTQPGTANTSEALNRPRILGLGFACIDDLLLLTEIPPPEGRATIKGRAQQGGGMVATAMVAIARLGGNASFITRVGDDATGADILSEFRHEGVDVSHAIVSAGETSHRTIVLVDGRSGARAFLSGRGTAGDVLPNDLRPDYVKSAAYLHLSDAGPGALRAAKLINDSGGAVCLDGTHFHPSVTSLLPSLRYLVVSRFFASEFMAAQSGRTLGAAARDYAGTLVTRNQATRIDLPDHDGTEADILEGTELLDAARRLRGEGPSVVVVTEGENGCWCASPDGDFHTPAFIAPAVVDTTGAGDVFHGAFLLARANGLDLGGALEFASAVAALKCRSLGGRAGIPTMEETLSFMASAPRQGRA